MQFMTRTVSVGTAIAFLVLGLILGTLLMPVQNAVSDDETVSPAPERKLIEIYRIAPGKHEAFLRDIASYDVANEMAGLPPRELFVHSDGASWDFMLVQPAKTPEGKSEALSAAWDELGLPSGINFFLDFRENITEHSDTFAYGPTNAAEVLSSIDD